MQNRILAPWLRALFAVTLGLVIASGAAEAVVPATLSYQGLLRDAGGTIPPDAQHAFVFRLYNVETGGSALWQESQTLLVTGGIFHALLGAVTPLALPFDAQYWLETTVDGSPLAPRVKLASSPYAQRAAVADALAGGGGSGDITAVYADDGLTGGATSGDAHLSVNAGTGLVVIGDQVRLTDAYASGTAHDARFVNEGQAGSVTAEMIVPTVVASVDGVVSDGDNIDLIAGPNVTITPDDVNNTITIAAAGGSGGIGGGGTLGYLPKFTGATTIGNSLVHDMGTRVGIGTTDPGARLSVETGSSYDEVLSLRSDFITQVALETTDEEGVAWLFMRHGGGSGLTTSYLSEDASGLRIIRSAAAGGIFLGSSTPDPNHNSAVVAMYNGSSLADHIGIRGASKPADWYGVGGTFEGGYQGAVGIVHPTGSNTYFGLCGQASGGSGYNYAVHGYATGSGFNCGLYGHASGGTNYAGYLDGNTHIAGNLTVSGVKSFRIDHPQDPAGRYLNHFCVESDEVLNSYSGNVVLDAAGEAWVELAGWFDAINRDPRYQLTCIGGQAPVYVAEEITDNRFRIAGGRPGLKVSWQVTAVRSDPAAAKYRMPVEQDKPAPERGKYLDPELYGAPDALRLGRIEEKGRP